MKRNNFFSTRLLFAGIVSLSILTIACNNNDTTSPPVESDTAAMSATDTTMHHDSGVNVTQSTDTAMNKGTAKPNPAKKGMKGKVTVMESPKLSGSMEADNTGVYANVEVYPSFPGGNKGVQDYFDKNLAYPADAANDGVEGTVNVMFTVDETGKLTNPHIMGDKLGYGLEEEALRVVKAMPQWNPGKLKGKNVKTRFTLPVSFQLY